MKKWAIIGGIIAVIVLALVIGLLYWGAEGAPTFRLMQISIVFISLFAAFSIILLAAILGAIVWLVFTLRDKVVPLLETLTDTATRIKGTTEFVTERAVTPIIGVSATMARMRAMTKTVTGGRRTPVSRKRKEAS